MDKVVLGKAVKLHGYLGGFKVNAKFDDDFDINKITEVFDESKNEYKVNRIFKVKDGVVLMLEGVDGKKAKSFLNKNILIDRSVVGEKMLIEDLKGSKLYFDDDTFVGTITDIQDYGTAEVFYVSAENGKEILFSNVKGVIKNFDLNNKKLVVNKSKFDEVSDENWYFDSFPK